MTAGSRGESFAAQSSALAPEEHVKSAMTRRPNRGSLGRRSLRWLKQRPLLLALVAAALTAIGGSRLGRPAGQDGVGFRRSSRPRADGRRWAPLPAPGARGGAGAREPQLRTGDRQRQRPVHQRAGPSLRAGHPRLRDRSSVAAQLHRAHRRLRVRDQGRLLCLRRRRPNIVGQLDATVARGRRTSRGSTRTAGLVRPRITTTPTTTPSCTTRPSAASRRTVAGWSTSTPSRGTSSVGGWLTKHSALGVS